MSLSNEKQISGSLSSSCSDEFEEVPLRSQRHSSNASTSSFDQVDTTWKKKSSKKKLKVPWNVLENSDVPNEPIALPYYVRNAIRHVFSLLDSKDKGNGLIAKTRLQVISATICLTYNIAHVADELVGFNGDKTVLTFEELISYLETAVFIKVSSASLDLLKLEETAWRIVSNEGKGTQKFSDTNLFTLWRIFNKLTIESNKLHVDEVGILIRNFMQAIGTEWNNELLVDFTKEKGLGFWDVVECLETEYLDETPESVYIEGIDSLTQKYLQEIIRTGNLKKKGHQVKSIKSRWFVYAPHLLTYYETKSMLKKKGDIAINSKSKVENLADTKTSKCRFTVSCGATGKIFELEASDQRNKNEWMSAIKQCMVIDDDVTPLMVELSNRSDKRDERSKRESCLELERLEKEAFLRKQQQELEAARLEVERANIQAGIEAAQKEEERKRREALEEENAKQAEFGKLYEEEKEKRQKEEMEREAALEMLEHARLECSTEASLREEERKRREELEVMNIEYEKLLEEERLARKEEETARTRQQEMFDLENAKRLELERIRTEQDEILAAERKQREGLEETSKEQAKILDEERERLKQLDEAYKSAAAEVEAAHAKLEASEQASLEAALKVEEAKERTRRMTGANGLSKIIAPKISHTTHRGMGAFTEIDFSKTPIYLSNEERPVAINQTEISEGEERIQIVETNLVKPSEFSKKIDMV